MGTTDISLDDVTFVNCDPAYVPDNTRNLTCDFEEDTCGWYQEQHEDDFDWKYGQGSSSGNLATTGPGGSKGHKNCCVLFLLNAIKSLIVTYMVQALKLKQNNYDNDPTISIKQFVDFFVLGCNVFYIRL